MKCLITLVVLLALAATASAGNVTKASIKHQLSIKDNCLAGDGCATALGFSLTTTMEADITQLEADGFSPNTLIQGSFPLGPSSSFRLSEDPNYLPGDTSVKINNTTVFNNIAWKKTISMRWDKGKLKLKAKISAKQNLGNFSPDAEAIAKTQSKLVSPTQVLITLIGDNLNDQFLNLVAPAATSVSTSNSAKPKKGATQFQSKQSISGTF